MKKTPYEVLAQLKEMATVLINYHFSLANKVEVREYSKVQSNAAAGPRIVLSPKNGQHMTIYVTPDGESIYLHENDLHYYTDDAKAFIGKHQTKYVIFMISSPCPAAKAMEAAGHDVTDAIHRNIFCETRSEFDAAAATRQINTIEILEEFETDQSPWLYAEKWYNGWEHEHKDSAQQFLFDDDGGDGNTEPDMSDNMLYAGTIG